MLPILPIFPKKVAKSALLLGFQRVIPVNSANPISNIPAMDPPRFCFVSMDEGAARAWICPGSQGKARDYDRGRDEGLNLTPPSKPDVPD
jgi:hypothetical protein